MKTLAIKADISEKSAELKKISNNLERFISRTDKTMVEYSQQLSMSEFELRQVEEIVWDIRGVPTNVIITQTQGIEAAVLAGDDNRAGIVLNRMKVTLEKLASEKITTIGEYHEKVIKESLDKTKASHPIDTAKVYEILKSIPVDRKE